MSGQPVGWRSMAHSTSLRPGWKLVRSHLQVTLIAQIISIGSIGLVLVFAGQAPTSADSAIEEFRLSPITVVVVLLLLISVLSGLVAASIGSRLARSYGQRIQQLAEATEAAASGKLSTRVVVQALDEIGQLGKCFNVLIEQLDLAQQSRRRFVANISHELRTPLAIIRGHVESQLGGTSDDGREALEVIARETHVLSTLIEDLFTLTRVDEASMVLHARPVSVQEIVAAAVVAIGPLASRQGQIMVHSTVPANLPPAHADPERLAQIFNNLLYNALRHTPTGGLIVIEGALTAAGEAMTLSVSDTGLGIDAAELPFIFERFYRGEGRREGSNGLGLAIVKELVEAHGGVVEASSTPGQGTTIRFTLPCAD